MKRKSMIKYLIKHITPYLPLSIVRAEWDDPILSIGGPAWSFNTTSNWRIVDESHLIAGCEDGSANETISALKGRAIVSCEPMSENPALDPRFILSNGTKLEIFSATFFEPWILRLPGLREPTIVASPCECDWETD